MDRGLLLNPLYQHSIVLGDFNTHHPWWDPLHDKSPAADDLVEWVTTSNLLLLNEPGTGTFYRPYMEIPTVIDLTLTTTNLVDKVQDWQTLPDIGSDHYGILFNIINTSTTSINNIINSRFDTKRADWDLFKKTLSLKIAKSTISTQIDDLTNLSNLSSLRELQLSELHQKMDIIAGILTDAIIDASNASIPRTTITIKSKPWWTENLRNLRKTIMALNRKVKINPYYHRQYQEAKNQYYNAIKRAKIDH